MREQFCVILSVVVVICVVGRQRDIIVAAVHGVGRGSAAVLLRERIGVRRS